MKDTWCRLLCNPAMIAPIPAPLLTVWCDVPFECYLRQRAPSIGTWSLLLPIVPPKGFVPDFIVRLKTDPVVYLILETKGYDERAEIKAQAAERWVKAVNADGSYGAWRYAMVRKPGEVAAAISEVAAP